MSQLCHIHNEDKNCGIICLEMILNSINDSIKNYDIDDKENMNKISIYDLCNTIGKIGYDCRPVKVNVENIDLLPTPFITYMEYGHYVNVWSVGREKVVISDPSYSTEIEFSKRLFLRKWTSRERGILILIGENSIKNLKLQAQS